MDILKIQRRINSMYAEKFKDYKGGYGLSAPHIPRISQGYLDNRVIVLGQETNTWYPDGDDDLKDFFQNFNEERRTSLTKRYDTFVFEQVENYGGKFWDFNRLLYSKTILHGNIVSNGFLSHCWMNLFVVEGVRRKNKAEGRPSKDYSLAKKIMEMQQDLLYEVFDLLKPKLIISLTGHGLDNFLFENALCLSESERQTLTVDAHVLTTEMLGEIIVTRKNHPLINCRIIRCYHPTYFMGYINANKGLREKIAYEGHPISNSKYYEMKLMEKLRSFF